MINLENFYIEKCNTPSDINEHLPTLKKYAEECSHITEMGVRWVVSTYGLLMGKPKKMISYNINSISWDYLKDITNEVGIDFTFKVGDTRDIIIEETDLLFIDTWHVYDQLKIELELHSNKVMKYIILHDTTSFEYIGETITGSEQYRGLWPAIEEFLETNPKWVLHERYTNNNGLTILKRV